MNDKIGRSAEARFAEWADEEGYFPFYAPSSKRGQPCDFALLREGDCLLVDVKHCEGERFPFSRIEPNQRACFSLAKRKGVPCFLALERKGKEGDFRLLPFSRVEEMEREGKKSLSLKEAWDED